jgi:hypothetical protein
MTVALNLQTTDTLQKRLEEICESKPQNDKDVFERRVLASFKCLQAAKLPLLQNEKEALWKGALCSLNKDLNNLRQFQTEFPEIYKHCSYANLVKKIEQAIEDAGIQFKKFTPFQGYKVNRPMNKFNGDRLILGCGRAYTDCGGHDLQKDYLVTIDDTKGPDLCANYHSSIFWNEFPKDRFSEINFEGFLPLPDKAALQQIARILKPTGIVRMGWSHEFSGVLNYVHEIRPDVFDQYINECGFAHFAITKEPICPNGRDDGEILVLRKQKPETL